MPTLLNEKGFRFFFYSKENNEPCHVHVEKGNAEGKIWLEPIVKIGFLINFTKSEEKDILTIINNNQENFKTRWYEYFNQ